MDQNDQVISLIKKLKSEILCFQVALQKIFSTGFRLISHRDVNMILLLIHVSVDFIIKCVSIVGDQWYFQSKELHKEEFLLYSLSINTKLLLQR